MKRRALIGTLGAGLAGFGGCLRLTGESQPPETDTESQTPEAGDESQAPQSGQLSLREHWTVEPNFEHIWTDANRFYFNGYGWAGAADHGSGLRWQKEIQFQDASDGIFAGDAFAMNSAYTVFGFYPDSAYNETVNGYFVAFDRRNPGTQLWTYQAPTDGGENYPIGAAIVDDVVVLAVAHDNNASEPWVAGVELSSGEEVWRLDTSGVGEGSATFVGSYDGEVYVGMSGLNPAPPGIQVVAPDDGSVTETMDDWVIGEIDEKSGAEIHGSTLFGVTADKNGVSTAPLDSSGVDWGTELTGDSMASVSTTLFVDTALVLVGTDNGQLYALERDTGDVRWSVSLNAEVTSVTASDSNVWAANTEGGLFAYDRTSGEEVHSSVKPVNGSDIAVVDDVIAFGDGKAYSIATDS